MTRLVAVLGYSDGRAPELHPRVCGTTRPGGCEVAGPDDVVLFSGWARRRLRPLPRPI